MSTDSDIIRRSAATPSAFADLFDRHLGVVSRYVRRRLGDDAYEDVVSETFLVAFRRRADFDHTWDSALPWLLGIASRTAAKHRTVEARQWRAYEASAARGEHTADGGMDAATSRLDADAAVRSLAPRIAALSARDRETLLLYAWGDLTQEQIATALGIPVGTVASRLNRVRRKLAPAGSHTRARLTWMGTEENDGRLGAGA